MRYLPVLVFCITYPCVSVAQHGVYFDYHNPSAESPKHLNHPHVDGVFLRFSWQELEPQKGQYNFQPIETMIAPWVETGHRVILGVKPAGQQNTDTPEWVYDEVPAITYARKGIQVKVPTYWHANYQDAQKGLVIALGKKYNYDDRIEGFLVGVAHLGFITACPNKTGSLAFLDAGWTPRKWQIHVFNTVRSYESHLDRKFLFLNGSNLILKINDPSAEGFPDSERYFVDLRDKIFSLMVNKHRLGVASNGLDADAQTFLATGIPELYDSFRKKATKGIVPLAVHDDWPLWVPADKRHGVNEGKDNDYFSTALENAIGGVRDIPKMNVVWMKMLDTDLQCTDPADENYQEECEAALLKFKNGLLK